MSAVLDEPARTDQEILAEARARFKLADTAESSNRTKAITALKFGNGDQWPSDTKNGRESSFRPCLTINITDAMVRRVVNACRENRPRIKCHPVGDGADVKTAKLIDGLIRHIENASSADYAYDGALESAIRGGWGYFRVNSQYVDDRSDDQDLTIERIRNPFTVYFDPASELPDGSDANWCLVSTMVPRSEYKAQYGEIDLAFDLVGSGDSMADWASKTEVRIAEYWRVAKKDDVLWLMSDGSKRFASELTGQKGEAFAAAGISKVRNLRRLQRRFVEWYKITGTKVLETRDWPGRWIPIIPVYGRELDINGVISRKGMIEDLMDPARMYNYGQSTLTEINALQPKAPWLGPKGFMEGNEAAWRDTNRTPIVALEYVPIQNPDGSMAPPPARQFPAPAAEGLAQWVQGSQSDFMAVAGMPHDPNQDAKGEVVSGLALKRRQGLSDISHYDFYDNFCRSLRHAGSIILDLVPAFYDTQRLVRSISDDGIPAMIGINEKTAENLIKNNLQVGRYEATIDTGPSYQTKREESAEAMLELLATPLGEMTAKVAGDVVVRAMDFPDADTVADRLAASMPGANIDKNSDIPPKAQMMIQGLQQQLKDANQHNLALQLEIQSKMNLEKLKQDSETERTRMTLQTKVKDTESRERTAIHDTHVKAVTAHDVAEINAAGKLLDTHANAEHNLDLAKETAKHADQAEKRAE